MYLIAAGIPRFYQREVTELTIRKHFVPKKLIIDVKRQYMLRPRGTGEYGVW